MSREAVGGDVARIKRSKPKQVVYLFGAGATQAETDYLGAQPVNLLMRDSEKAGEGISTAILKKMQSDHSSHRERAGDVDIEKLMSLLAASGVRSLISRAEKMRRLYYDEIETRIVASKILDRPSLAIALLEMHRANSFAREVESLSGIITTNHDGLLHTASQEVFQGLNLGFPFNSSDFTAVTADAAPPIVELHGSLAWRFGIPLTVRRLGQRDNRRTDVVWIPPTILKESATYPFNKLMGIAYELLAKHCDVLRIVGASLSQNDWNILSLIFNAQRHRELRLGTGFRIELIMSQKGGETIRTNCSFLQNLTPIGHLSEGRFSEYTQETAAQEPEMANAFAYWLKEKLRFHHRRNEFKQLRLDGAMAAVAGDAA